MQNDALLPHRRGLVPHFWDWSFAICRWLLWETSTLICVNLCNLSTTSAWLLNISVPLCVCVKNDNGVSFVIMNLKLSHCFSKSY